MKIFRMLGFRTVYALYIGLIGFFCGLNLNADADSKRPNILFIYTDDQSHRTLSCYEDFGARPWVRTPHIDRLAHEGVLFSTAYGASWCAPSRASVLTGLLPSREHFNSQGNRLVSTIN